MLSRKPREQDEGRVVDRVNLDTKLDRHELRIQPMESPEDADYRRWKDRILFMVAVLLTVVLFVAALIAFFKGTPDQRTWAGPALTLILGAFIGYLTGKNSK